MGDFWTPEGGGTDPDAIHDNVAGEIAAVTEKTTPVSGDFLLIEDSAASNAKKRLQVGNLPSGFASDVPAWSSAFATRLAHETGHADDQFWSAGAAASYGGTVLTVTGTATWLEGEHHLSARISGSTAGDVTAVILPLTPTSPPVTIEVAAKLNATNTSGNGSWMGLGFCDGSSATSVHASNAMSFVSGIANGQTRELIGTFTNFAGTHNNSGGALNATLGNYVYMRCVWVAANNFENEWSFDRLHWSPYSIGNFITTGFTPTDICLWVTDNGSSVATNVAFGPVRVYESDLSS